MQKTEVNLYHTEGGEFWAIWRAGHWAADSFLSAVRNTPCCAAEIAALEELLERPLGPGDLCHCWLRPRDDGLVHFCDADSDGALAVTAITAAQIERAAGAQRAG